MENKEKINEFIDEYTEFQTEKAVANTLCEVYKENLNRLTNELELYRDKPEFVEVVARLQVQIQTATEEYEQAVYTSNQLSKRAKGFEGRRYDTLSELFDENQRQY